MNFGTRDLLLILKNIYLFKYMKRQLAILGSTGSIGTQALEVISEHADLFEVYALTANNQVDLLINQARKFLWRLW